MKLEPNHDDDHITYILQFTVWENKPAIPQMGFIENHVRFHQRALIITILFLIWCTKSEQIKMPIKDFEEGIMIVFGFVI